MGAQAGYKNNTEDIALEQVVSKYVFCRVGSLLDLWDDILIIERIEHFHGLFGNTVISLLPRRGRTGLPRRGALERHDDGARKPKGSGFGWSDYTYYRA